MENRDKRQQVLFYINVRLCLIGADKIDVGGIE